MDQVLVAFAAVLVVTVVAALGLAVAKWRGMRRLAAIVIALALVSHVVKVVFDIQRDAHSHTLWPFEAVIVAGGALLVLGVVALVRPNQRRSD